MNDIYVEGYTTEARYCAFCGERMGRFSADGSCKCGRCDRSFFVIEKDMEVEE